VAKLKGEPFALVGIHVGGTDAHQLKEIMEKEKLSWRSFVDGGTAGAGPIAAKWNLAATPTFYLIDHRGIIRYKWMGPPGEKIVDAAIGKLVAEATREKRNPGE
jgi:hypothetical protein